ncbi:MAG: hypothetical protein KF883_02755 [Thermomicrobiales bacterium]|nr:hypothetical protein [Thermomicrobiales bacterium]
MGAKTIAAVAAAIVGGAASFFLVLGGIYQIFPGWLPALPPERLGATLLDVSLEEINPNADGKSFKISYTVEFSGFGNRHAYGTYAVFRHSLKTVGDTTYLTQSRDPWYMTDDGEDQPAWSRDFATFGFEADESDRFSGEFLIERGPEGSCVFVRVYIFDSKPYDIRTVTPAHDGSPEAIDFDVDDLLSNHRLDYADSAPFNTHEQVPACEELGIATI